MHGGKDGQQQHAEAPPTQQWTRRRDVWGGVYFSMNKSRQVSLYHQASLRNEGWTAGAHEYRKEDWVLLPSTGNRRSSAYSMLMLNAVSKVTSWLERHSDISQGNRRNSCRWNWKMEREANVKRTHEALDAGKTWLRKEEAHGKHDQTTHFFRLVHKINSEGIVNYH